MHFGGYDIKLCHILQNLGGHAPKNTELMTVDFSIWVAMLRNGTVSGDFDLFKSKLGGYAPEWVAMLRNRGMPEGCFGGKIAIWGGFAPENSTVPKPQKLGGHAPEHPIQSLITKTCKALKERLPRNKYRDIDRDRLTYAKHRKHTRAATVKLRRRLLGLLSKQIGQWNRICKIHTVDIALTAEQSKRLSALKEVYE